MDSSILILLTTIQSCPCCKHLPTTAACTASLRSASVSTRWVGTTELENNVFEVFTAALLASSILAIDDPVNEMRLGIGCDTNSSPICEPAPTITLSSSGGRPASSKTLAISTPPVTGVSLVGSTTTALPRASVGAIER